MNLVWQIMLICWPKPMPGPLLSSHFPARVATWQTHFWLKRYKENSPGCPGSSRHPNSDDHPETRKERPRELSAAEYLQDFLLWEENQIPFVFTHNKCVSYHIHRAHVCMWVKEEVKTQKANTRPLKVSCVWSHAIINIHSSVCFHMCENK